MRKKDNFVCTDSLIITPALRSRVLVRYSDIFADRLRLTGGSCAAGMQPEQVVVTSCMSDREYA